MTNDRRLYFIVGAILVAALIGMKLIPVHKHKVRQRTEKEMAHNACSASAYAKYTQEKNALTGPSDASAPTVISVEKIVARRRLEEDFCVEFVRCVRGEPGSVPRASSLFASQFDSCLRDRAFEQYDAVPRDDDSDVP